MKDSLNAHLAGANIQPKVGASPAWSVDSARGALLWFGLTFLTAALGALASAHAAEFYAALQLPSWAPPASVFGPVWSGLYLLMAVAAWIIWRDRHITKCTDALVLYSVALVPNVLWSWLFFNWHLGLWALVDVTVLWILVALTVRAFWRIRPLAGWLMVPLWVWVSFAGVLNAAVWKANPALLG